MGPNQNMTQPVQSALDGKEIVFRTEADKKGKGMVVGMVILALLAAGGIGFGVWAMLSKNQEVTSLNEKINELNTQLADNENKDDDETNVDDMNTDNTGDGVTVVELSDEVATKILEAGLNGDIAVKLLEEASVGKQLGYGVGYANVYADCSSDGKVAYWVKYANGHRVSEDVAQFGDVIFEKNAEGNWTFELPGFTGDAELIQKYTTECAALK